MIIHVCELVIHFLRRMITQSGALLFHPFILTQSIKSNILISVSSQCRRKTLNIGNNAFEYQINDLVAFFFISRWERKPNNWLQVVAQNTCELVDRILNEMAIYIVQGTWLIWTRHPRICTKYELISSYWK